MALDLFVDYRARKLVQSSVNGDGYTLPPWVQNDNTPIRITVLDSDGVGIIPTYTKRAPSEYGLRVGLFLSDNTQLAYQASFTDDATNRHKSANLTANSANQTTALTAANPATCYLEIEITADGGANYETILPKSRGQTTLEKEAIATGASTVPGNDTAVTVGNLAGLVAALIRNGFILRNETANIERNFHLDEYGQLQGGPTVPLP